MRKMNLRAKTILMVALGLVVSMGLISYLFAQHTDKKGNDSTEASGALATHNGGEGALELQKDKLKLLTIKNVDKSVHWPISGRVVPKNTTRLFAEVQGKVLAQGFRLKKGVSFSAGETLIRLDAKEFAFQLESQRSTFLNILTGMMPDLKADYPENYEPWLQYVQNYEAGSGLLPLPNTKSDGEKYFITSQQVYSTYFSIKAQEERLSKFQILAPYDGLVTEATADKGTLVSPNQSLGVIINNKEFELEAAVNIKIATYLKIGDKVVFENNEITETWVGTVTRLNDLIDTQTQNVPVYFSISGRNLKAGMYLEGAFSGEVFQSVSAIPTKALNRDSKVLLLADDVIRSKTVEIVESMQDTLLVKGLADQDQLIVNHFTIPVEGLKLSR